MTLVFGHLVEGRAYAFPHLCPGEACAIWRWLHVKASVLPPPEPRVACETVIAPESARWIAWS